MKEKKENQLLDCEEASLYLGLPKSRIRYEVFLKRIPHIKIGRSVRFTREQLNAWIEQHIAGGKNE